jgi:hypothetical protein
MVGHLFCLRVEHRVIDQAHYAGRRGGLKGQATDHDFVGTHVGADEIAGLNSVHGLPESGFSVHIAPHHLLGTQVPKLGRLFRATHPSQHHRPSADEGANHGLTCLTGCTCNQDHPYT